MVSLNDMHPFSLMFSEDISHKGTPPSTHPPPECSFCASPVATHTTPHTTHHTPHTHTHTCVALRLYSARVAVCGVRDRLRSDRCVHLDVRGQLPARERLQDVAWYPPKLPSVASTSTTVIRILTDDVIFLSPSSSSNVVCSGISLILQNAIIFASSVVLLFARKTEEEEMIM